MTSIEQAPTPVPTPPHRLAILDDHELIVDGLARWFTDVAADFNVVIRATSWMDLVRDPEFPVDLVLMDLQLGDTVSIESRIRACRAAGAKVIVVTAIDDEESRRRSLVAGAAGFVSKTLPADELVDYARRVMRGERVQRQPSSADPVAAGAGVVPDRHGVALSAAEEKALRYYAQGLSTVEVGRRMEVGYETAKTYLRRVREKYAKAGRPASRKAELIRRAAEDGYLE
ncbi:DNA-binding NarL/FixJ family response regulator [Agromyces hippuratus]|uniref:DNA-binding NarL/FixJ family response regulator n=1 Tax=Agromyces hippuratus TaxID=286438 RepID=A0A852WXL6_9MICO|nr:response regulator transcription factor [Agromyces hippuratus]NYG20663.1 DNA-binding NarL/FixJ family response regulator [Agromyces hippuratus]